MADKSAPEIGRAGRAVWRGRERKGDGEGKLEKTQDLPYCF